MNVRRLMCPPRHLPRGNVATLKSKLSYHVGIGPDTPNVTAPWPSRIRLPNVAFGSKPEKLNASTCFPLCPRKRTSGGRVGMSVQCQKQSFTVGDSSALNRCLQRSLRSASALLLCKFQGAVRKRAGVASECRHIDRLRPPVGHVMI